MTNSKKKLRTPPLHIIDKELILQTKNSIDLPPDIELFQMRDEENRKNKELNKAAEALQNEITSFISQIQSIFLEINISEENLKRKNSIEKVEGYSIKEADRSSISSRNFCLSEDDCFFRSLILFSSFAFHLNYRIARLIKQIEE